MAHYDITHNCDWSYTFLIDVKMEDCTIDASKIESEINAKTKAIMPVHLLGNPAHMDTINDLAKKYDLYVIEDTCEAHGALYKNQKCGGLGDIGTFSFFFSHHITTMEGGMIMSNNDHLSELMRIMRSQGVIRNTLNKETLTKEYKENIDYKDIDPNYLFANIGFNLRPTELNGGFGLEQIKKIDPILEHRRRIGNYLLDKLEKHSEFFQFPIQNRQDSAWFCFPIIIREYAPFNRSDFSDYLKQMQIETRPIMSGNVEKQPAMKLFKYRNSDLKNANIIHQNGLFFGIHQEIGIQQCEYIINCIDDYLRKKLDNYSKLILKR